VSRAEIVLTVLCLVAYAAAFRVGYLLVKGEE
jgi:hypothetical protein